MIDKNWETSGPCIDISDLQNLTITHHSQYGVNMVRKLKHHEQKLLRKVDFVTYKSDGGHRDAQVVRRYAISKPSDYTKYNHICGSLRRLAHQLAALEPADPVRHKHEALLLEKLYDMGILGAAGSGGRGKLSEVENKITVSAMCRRRLGVVMTRLRMADNLQAVSALRVRID